MKTQHLRILILVLLLSFIFFFGYNNYKNLSEKNTSAFVLIPTNASLILQINDLKYFSKKLESSEIWKSCSQAKYMEGLQNDIHFLDSLISKITENKQLKIGTLYFSTHKSSYNDAAILFSTSINKGVDLAGFITDIFAIPPSEITTHNYENENIYQIKRKEKDYFLAKKEGVIFGSKSKILVQDAIRQFGAENNLLSNSAFAKVKETTKENAFANLYFNFNNLMDLSDIYTAEKQKKNIFLNHFSNWAATDIFIKNNSFFASGLTHSSSANTFLSAMKNQYAAGHNICEILPHNTSMIFELCINNAKSFSDKKNAFLQKHNAYYNWEKKKKYLAENHNFDINEFLKYVEDEVGIFTISSKSKDSFEQSFSFIKSKDIGQSSIFLSGLIKSENKTEYQEHTIFNIAEPKLVSFLFGDIFSMNENAYFVAIEDYLVFGNSKAAIEYIIDNYSSNTTLSSSNHFKNFEQQISSRSNIFFYINPGKSADLLSNTLNKKWNDLFTINEDSLQKFTAFALQLNVGSPLFLNNIILFYDKDFKEELKQEWYGQLDTAFAINPQIIYNYNSKKEEVFVQDKNNKIYLFSTSGEKLWEKEIGEKIMSNVSQIDFYKNKKLQILFNTKNKLYIIDRLGRWVKNYPKNLSFEATNGHALFDYSKNRNYRILIAANDGMLYNLDKKGKQVSGWKFKKTKSNLKDKVQHFVRNGKDYILYPSKDDKMQLLARNGSKRVSYNNIANFNFNPLQIDKNGTLYGITTNGKLWRGKLDGNATEIPLANLTANSKFLIHKNTLIYSNEKTVFVVDEKFDLLHSFEVASSIKEITAFNSNIIVKTNAALYLWKDGEMKDGTPIATDGFTVVNDLDKDNKLNLIISRDDFLYNYEIE